jgi:hypothetical protein
VVPMFMLLVLLEEESEACGTRAAPLKVEESGFRSGAATMGETINDNDRKMAIVRIIGKIFIFIISLLYQIDDKL